MGKIKNVRNFWVELEVDGRESTIATGPRGNDGGFYQDVYIRDKGEAKHAFRIIAQLKDAEGNLQIHIVPRDVPIKVVDNHLYLETKR